MVISLKMRSKATSGEESQSTLQAMLAKSPATHRFLTLFSSPLAPFVGRINEVFEAPKAEGVDFQFADGKRESFLNLIDPSTALGQVRLLKLTGDPTGPMVPDDPGTSHPDRIWRLMASAASAGISYREPGLAPSLHIAITDHGANVHLDREGFVTTIDERVSYDPKKVLNHLTADLASDFAPVLVSSLTVKDGTGRTRFQATVSPWLEVNLPGTKGIRGGKSKGSEVIGGMRLFGIFEAGGG